MAQSTATYDTQQAFEVRSYDIEYQNAHDESWQARIYQPQGEGPFPAILDVHGGAWNAGNRLNSELMCHSLASSGLVVAAVDFRLAPEHPYPAQVVDVNYATRWLKAHAREFNADGSSIGAHASSSGGHTMMLSAMRPNDPRYAELTSADVEGYDASVSYLLLTWPVLDPYARYLYSKETGRESLITNTEAYFLTEDAMKEGNPQHILEQGEQVQLPPTIIIQGTADLNVPMSIPHRFVEAYRAAGGEIQLEEFHDLPHGFGRQPGEATDRALDLMKRFVESRLAVQTTTV